MLTHGFVVDENGAKMSKYAPRSSPRSGGRDLASLRPRRVGLFKSGTFPIWQVGRQCHHARPINRIRCGFECRRWRESIRGQGGGEENEERHEQARAQARRCLCHASLQQTKQSERLSIWHQIVIRPSPYRRNRSRPAAYGAEVLRLWAALSDFRKDVAVGDEVLTKTRESLRKLRNVFRFMLSNLYDFDEARRYITAVARLPLHSLGQA